MSPSRGGACRVPRGACFDRSVVRVERQPRAALGLHLGKGPLELRAPGLPAHLADQELQPVALLVLVVAARGIEPHHRVGEVEDLARRQELEQQVSRGRQDRRAAGDGHAEAAARGAVHVDAGAQADVVDRGERVVLGAAFEPDLELARQLRAQRLAQQVARERLGVGRHVERLVRRDAGVRARRDVADGAAAGLARREPGLGEPPHHRLDVVELQEVELDVLPRRDVPEAARVALGDVRERLELRPVEDALRDLDPQHLRVARLPLAVRPAHQAEGPPLVGRQLAALVGVERADELVDLGLVRERQPRAAEGRGLSV